MGREGNWQNLVCPYISSAGNQKMDKGTGGVILTRSQGNPLSQGEQSPLLRPSLAPGHCSEERNSSSRNNGNENDRSTEISQRREANQMPVGRKRLARVHLESQEHLHVQHATQAEENQDIQAGNGERSREGIEETRPLHETLVSNDYKVLNAEIAQISERNRAVLLSRLQESSPHGRLAMINLSRRGLRASDANLLGEAIRNNPLLSVLKLGYNELGDEGVHTVASAMIQNGKHHTKLSVLDLGFNSLGDAGCESLAVSALAGNYTLQTLYLAGNCIGEKGALSIAGAILHGTGLLKLHLTANNIGSLGLKAIAGAIAKNDERVSVRAKMQIQSSEFRPSMRDLHVGNTGFRIDGFIALPGMLISNTSIQSICVANNAIGDQELLLLSQAFTQNKLVPIETLVLSFNEITCQGIECLMNAVWGSQTLRTLKLDNNKIRDRGAQLCAVALTSIPLRVLDLSFNRNISTTGVKALMKNISENDTLESLGLAGIHLDQNSSKAISYALAYNSSLRTLYLDNCSAGYASQRHIVAGIVSNQKASLRLVTGFELGPIAMTLGMPRLPETWSNDQVLGFIRFMWQQWLLKSGRGRTDPTNDIRGPAPPAAVAAASKIAFSALGASPGNLFQSELHEKRPAEQPPVDRAADALLERTSSGTLCMPVFTVAVEDDVNEWAGETRKQSQLLAPTSPSTVRRPLEDPERRNRNLEWLRMHFRALNDIGRLPFNNADLWQLHQFYFSPPYPETSDSENAEFADVETPDEERRVSDSVVPPPSPEPELRNASLVSRTVSFQTLGDAFAASGISSHSSHGHKRRSIEGLPEDIKPAAKRPKNLKTRIAYYPRIMDKIQALGTKPMEQTLSLLRQLKYTESIMFAERNPYEEGCASESGKSIHADVEMVLLDLL